MKATPDSFGWSEAIQDLAALLAIIATGIGLVRIFRRWRKKHPRLEMYLTRSRDKELQGRYYKPDMSKDGRILSFPNQVGVDPYDPSDRGYIVRVTFEIINESDQDYVLGVGSPKLKLRCGKLEIILENAQLSGLGKADDLTTIPANSTASFSIPEATLCELFAREGTTKSGTITASLLYQNKQEHSAEMNPRRTWLGSRAGAFKLFPGQKYIAAKPFMGTLLEVTTAEGLVEVTASRYKSLEGEEFDYLDLLNKVLFLSDPYLGLKPHKPSETYSYWYARRVVLISLFLLEVSRIEQKTFSSIETTDRHPAQANFYRQSLRAYRDSYMAAIFDGVYQQAGHYTPVAPKLMPVSQLLLEYEGGRNSWPYYFDANLPAPEYELLRSWFAEQNRKLGMA